jgi:2-polyprenyl-6-methoxyphenol hydroxylase-like FAD-dependent oxidoreductase
MDQISDVYYDRVSQIRMDGWSNGRVTLIGDAAACVCIGTSSEERSGDGSIIA